MNDAYSMKTSTPVLNSMEQGRVSPPLSSPDTERLTMPSSNPGSLEEGSGYYAMRQPTTPYPSSTDVNTSQVMESSENPSLWQKVKSTFGLGGKRRKSKKVARKSKRTKKTKKTLRKSTKKTKKSKRTKKTHRKLYGGTTQKVWIAQGKTPNGQYGGFNNVVNPYEPPMDFAPVHGIPTAQPHNMVG
jgi:hypothetical protein